MSCGDPYWNATTENNLVMLCDAFDKFGVLSHGIGTFAKALLEIFDCVQSNHTVALRGLLKGRNLQIMEIIGSFFCIAFNREFEFLPHIKN